MFHPNSIGSILLTAGEQESFRVISAPLIVACLASGWVSNNRDENHIHEKSHHSAAGHSFPAIGNTASPCSTSKRASSLGLDLSTDIVIVARDPKLCCIDLAMTMVPIILELTGLGLQCSRIVHLPSPIGKKLRYKHLVSKLCTVPASLRLHGEGFGFSSAAPTFSGPTMRG